MCMTTLGTFIKSHRERLGLTQQEFADRAGIQRAYLSRIETGDNKLPSADIRRKIAATIGVSHVDILVSAGELSAEEVSSLPARIVQDFRLQEINDAWPDITPQAQVHIHGLLAVPGIVVREEPRTARLAR
jgi:transcriptional regulator with XRE-family HTH domain